MIKVFFWGGRLSPELPENYAYGVGRCYSVKRSEAVRAATLMIIR